MGPAQAVRLGERVRRLRDRGKPSHSPPLHAQRRRVYERVWAEHGSAPAVLRSARPLAAFLSEKALVLDRDDLLAGGTQFCDHSVPEVADGAGSEARRGAVLTAFRRGYRVGLYCGGLGGHAIAGYARVLESGFGGAGGCRHRAARGGS